MGGRSAPRRRFAPLEAADADGGGGIYHQPPDPPDLSAGVRQPQLTLSRALARQRSASASRSRRTLDLRGRRLLQVARDLAARNELADAARGRSADPRRDRPQLRRPGPPAPGAVARASSAGSPTRSAAASARDHPDTRWRLFDYDQTHVLGVVASYQLGHGWDVGARFRYTTGLPRTPVVGAYYDARDDQYSPSSARRTPSGSPTSTSSTCGSRRPFVYRRVKLNVFLDVQNITDRQNPEEIVYNYNFTQRDYITGLPTLAVLGARVEF